MDSWVDMNVGISDTSVMTDDSTGTAGGPLFFPPGRPVDSGATEGTTPSASNADGPELREMTEGELRETVSALLAQLQRRSMEEIAAGQAYTDGTPAIDSMTAVWVVATIGKRVGRRLVKLSDVERESLCSVGGVARLVHRAIAEAIGQAGAA